MPISENEIAVGKCFATRSDQVRRVIEVGADDLVYESRGKQAGQWTGRQRVKRSTFAAAVDREVHCDWDPRFGGPSL
jgi:hypothetical protein